MTTYLLATPELKADSSVLQLVGASCHLSQEPRGKMQAELQA